MARSKIIENDELIRLIEKYFKEECYGNADRLTPKNITAYINNNGYPDYRDYLLRRNEEAQVYINKIKNTENKSIQTLVTFKTIDARRFVEEHNTDKKLIAGITSLNNYYKQVAESALKVFKDMKNYESVIDELKEENKALKENNDKLSNENTELKDKNYKLRRNIDDIKEERNIHKKVIDKYVNPEIADKLLKKEGIKFSNSEHIVEEPEIIDEETEIPFTKSMLKIISGGKQ